MSTSEDLPTRIRNERKRRRMSQQQLADAAGISKGTLGSFETHKREMQPENLRRALAALDMLDDDPSGPSGELEPGTSGQWAGWEKDVQTFLNIIGLYLEAQPERERGVIMREVTAFIFKRPRNGTNRIL